MRKKRMEKNLRHNNDMLLVLCLFGLFSFLKQGAADTVNVSQHFTRSHFPSDFVFGATTSAYQVEGAALLDGRTASIYDTFAHQRSSSYATQDPDVACDQYHKYKEDVQLMAETGLNAYRFSISWSRLIPNGRGPVNPKGLRYYNNLINELILHGIEPHVTLMHSDLPQILEDGYGGFLSPKIIDDFTSYVDVCFSEFGDRVTQWTTFNEANIFIFGGYDAGDTPPNRCSAPFGRNNCTKGDSTTEPYLAAHHLLLAHASAVQLYREKYQAKQRGCVGFNLLSYHFAPMTDTKEDIAAARRVYDFIVGWFMNPLKYGDYPEIVKKNAGSRIPIFTKNQSKILKGSFDFIGINYYYVMKTKDNPASLSKNPRDFLSDMAADWISSDTDAHPSQKKIFPIQPWGLEKVLEHFKEVYGNPPMYIHENGQMGKYSTSSVNDQFRVDYIKAHILGALKAVRNGSNTKGYFVWSLLDVYELLFGWNYTFGLYYVDYSDPNLSRHPKISQRWYSAFLKGKNVTLDFENNQSQDISLSAI